MIPYERRLQIAQLLEENEVVSLDELCDALGGVSESTVRRDLKTMEREGEITLLRGGGACLKRDSYEIPVMSKKMKKNYLICLIAVAIGFLLLCLLFDSRIS